MYEVPWSEILRRDYRVGNLNDLSKDEKDIDIKINK